MRLAETVTAGRYLHHVTDGALFDDAVGRDPTWTVAELSAHLGRVLAGALPDDVWVQGQIRNLNRSANGHVYFQLAEPAAAGEQPRSQLSVTLLSPEKQAVNEQLKRAGGAVRMADGIEVRIQGRVRWYGPRGVLQLRMHGIDPAFTIGRLQEDRDRILAALAADGLMDRNARLPVPRVPLRIGLVTSRGSAAHADVISELAASGIGFTVRSVDARTQGADSAASVTRALHLLAADEVDVILLVRGGGARTDLAAFDTELIARAIAAMPVPVFTGIGHEVDRSIADDVAHSAHKTPTAAAAAVVDRVRGFEADVADRALAIGRAVHRSLRVAGQRLDDRSTRTARGASRSLRAADARLDRPAASVGDRARRSLTAAARSLDTTEARVRAHDPQHALARGWSITTTDDGRLVRSPADAPPGTTLVTRLAHGQITSTVHQEPPA